MPSKNSPKNSNTGCLEGAECPRCGWLGPFKIAATAWFTVHDDGTEDHEDVEWGDKSRCLCLACSFSARLGRFKAEQEISRGLDFKGRKWIYPYVRMEQARGISCEISDERCPSCNRVSIVRWRGTDGQKYESCLNGCCSQLSRKLKLC